MGMIWKIEMLGALRVLAGAAAGLPPGTEARGFRSRKTVALLAYLALHTRRRHSRSELAEQFWPAATEEDARASLSAALSSLRRELERAPIPAGVVVRGERDLIWLEQVTTDVGEFEAALAGATREPDSGRAVAMLETAVALYRPSLLPGIEGDWVSPLQADLSERFVTAAETLFGHYEKEGRIQECLSLGRRALEEDPLRVGCRVSLMGLCARNGRPHEALKLFYDFERRFWEEYRSAPPREVRELAGEIRNAMAATGPPVIESSTQDTPDRRNRRAAVAPTAQIVSRGTDRALRAALEVGEGLILLKGARQTGKTTAVGTALAYAAHTGARVALTDLGALAGHRLSSTAAFLSGLAGELAEHIDLDSSEAEAAVSCDGPGRDFRRYLRRVVLDSGLPPLVWAIDEFDRILMQDFSTEVLGLFRAWFNERALESGGPWSRLILILSYSTEAHLHVRDLNQSPFNVGHTIELGDLTGEQVAQLNRLYGSPLTALEIERLRAVVDGHPGLLCRSFQHLSRGTISLREIEQQAGRMGGIFAGHLQRLWDAVSRDPELSTVLAAILQRRGCPRDDEFLRLRSAGILAGDAPEEARIRCVLYAQYFSRRLGVR